MARPKKKFSGSKEKSLRRVPKSRIARYLESAKGAFRKEAQIISRIKTNDNRIAELSKSDDPLANIQIAVFQSYNKDYNNRLTRVRSVRVGFESKIQKAIEKNNAVDSARNAN